MKSLFHLAALALLCVSALAQNPSQASDQHVVVGNPSQPVQWKHRESIKAAIADAGPNGTVWIPANYLGTDCNPITICNPGTTLVVDLRGGFNTYPASVFALPINLSIAGSVTAGGPVTIGPSTPGGISAILFNGPDQYGLANALGYDQLTDLYDPATGSSALGWDPNGLVNERIFTTAFQSVSYQHGNIWAFNFNAGLPTVVQGATIDPATGAASFPSASVNGSPVCTAANNQCTGTGASVSGTPTADQIAIWATGTSIKGLDMSGDATMALGVVTNTGLKGHAVPAPSSGYFHWNGSAFVWDTPSGTIASQVKGQTAIGLTASTLTTSSDFVRVSTYCGSTTACNTTYVDESHAIAAIFSAVNGPVSIIDDMCGLQYWTEQIFTKPGAMYIRANCPTSNPHIIKVDGVSTITTPSGFHFIGAGPGGQAYPAAVINTFISGCNPAVETCPLGGFVTQNSSATTITTTVVGNEMTVALAAGAPFTTCAANGVCSTATQQNAMQQYRRGCIVGSSVMNNNGCWFYDTTVANGISPVTAQSFKFWVVSGVTSNCASSCGTLILDTDVMSVGKGGGGPTVYHTTLEHLQIDGNYLPGVEGFVNGQGEEGTGVFDVQVWNAMVGYGRLDTSNAYGGGATGSANAEGGGPWAGNIANTTCNIIAGCACQQPLTASVTYNNSGHTITWVSGSQFPFNITSVALSGTTGGPFTVNQNGVNASGKTLTYVGTASPASGSATATLSNPGMTACAANTTPGLAPSGTFMGCGNGGDGSDTSSAQPIVSAFGGDPCYNPNFAGFALTGGTGGQGQGLVQGHTTNSIADKSNGGGHGIWQMIGSGATQAVGFMVIGDHGGFIDTHTEYTNIGAEVCGNVNKNATWEEAYAANAIPTTGVIFMGGFMNYNVSAGIDVDIGQSGAAATCQQVLFQGINTGGSGTTISDNINGNTCTDQFFSYELGNATKPVLKNSCTTGSGPREPLLIGSGSTAMGTSAIASGACATVITVSVPGTKTTDRIHPSYNGDVSGITGYNPATGLVDPKIYPSADNINFKVCNPTGSSITPGAVTFNWDVTR